MKKIISLIVGFLIISSSLSSITSSIVFASSDDWSEVTRFTGGTHERAHKTESFTCDHVEWRIRWEYEPRTDIPENQTGIQFYVYTQENPDHWFKGMAHWGEYGKTGKPPNGTEYIHDKNGTFHLEIISSAQSYTLIIEQDLESIPEFPAWIILPLLLTATLLIMVGKKRLPKTPNQQSY